MSASAAGIKVQRCLAVGFPVATRSASAAGAKAEQCLAAGIPAGRAA